MTTPPASAHGQTGNRARTIARVILALFYLVAAWFHLTTPKPFLSIMPGWVPMPETVVAWTGVAEGLGAIALAQGISPRLRRAGAIGLALYAVGVFPANIHHFALDMAQPAIGPDHRLDHGPDRGLGLAYHLPRMVAQPILIWLALWAGGVTDWPWRRRKNSLS